LEAAEFVRSIQHRQGLLVGCPEEIAFTKRFIDEACLADLAAKCGKTAYGRYLQRLAEEPRSAVPAPALVPDDVELPAPHRVAVR
jgi:dTDP-glucose pyrophosphorylase